MLLSIGNCLARLRNQNPLVCCLTNTVTENDCANALLAVGASPVMTQAPEETPELVQAADALYLNIGTVTERSLSQMLLAAETAHNLGKPVVLDPVGAGATHFRTRVVQKILDTDAVTLLRGNISEIRAIAGISSATRGVDATASDDAVAQREENHQLSRDLARQKRFLVGISGPIDRISDGTNLILVKNGHPLMPRICGTGCILSALTAATLGVFTEEPLTAVTTAFCLNAIAGEMALGTLSPKEGMGMARVRFLDALTRIDSSIMTSQGSYEVR